MFILFKTLQKSLEKMNETRLWCCDICDKTKNIKIKSKHIKSKSHKHKEKFI